LPPRRDGVVGLLCITLPWITFKRRAAVSRPLSQTALFLETVLWNVQWTVHRFHCP
jgi:hypothetical protein